MKKINITDQVMSQVQNFERKRSRLWLVRYGFILLLGLSVIGYAGWNIYLSLSDREFLLMLPLYTEDWETFKESWQEATSFVWENLPQVLVVAGIVAFFAIVIFFLKNRRRQKIMVRRLKETRRYR